MPTHLDHPWELRRSTGLLYSYRDGTEMPPPAPVTASPLRGVYPGGGGQSSIDISPFNEDWVAVGTDTGCARISHAGMDGSFPHFLGVSGYRSRQVDGVAWSRNVPGRLFMTCGDGAAGSTTGGLFVCEGANTRNPTRWERLDGVAGPKLMFDGGNNNLPASPSLSTPYPRRYGRNIIVDGTSVAGHTLIHVATVNDGAWRIKMRNSDGVAVEQVQYAGTGGQFIRFLQMAHYEPNVDENAYGRLIIGSYHGATPIKPRLCINAADTAASPTLSTAIITNAPTNVEAAGYVKVAGGQPVTVFAGQGYVGLSVDAFTSAGASVTACANAITMTNTARTIAQNNGPETTEKWFSVGTTQVGANYAISVGTFGGRVIGSDTVNTIWRGVVPQSSATPWSSIAWTPITYPTNISEQVMNRPGADNLDWLTDQTTPGRNTSAAVSMFATAPSNPNRMFFTARGTTYRSDDAGLHWYPTETWGSAEHKCWAWDRWVNKTRSITGTGDWAWNTSLDDFATQPHQILWWGGRNTSACAFDPKTGEALWGGCDGGSHNVPDLHAANTIWGISAANMVNQYRTAGATPDVDYNLYTTAGPTGVVGAPMALAPTYGNGGLGTTRALIVATKDGLWYSRTGGTTWTKITSAQGTPFGTTGPFDAGILEIDLARNKVYAMDRAQGTLWRMDVAADGTVSGCTKLFTRTWVNYGTSPDSAGYISLDEANNRMWISTLNGVYFINNVSAVGTNAGVGNATEAGFAATYPGELAGPLVYSPYESAVLVATLGLTSAGAPNYAPTRNGASGPRMLCVTNATTAASWATADDWSITRDTANRVGFQAPHGIARNWNGKLIAVTQQGTGAALWTSP